MAIKTGLFGSLKIKSEQVKNIVLGSKFSKFSNSELEISAGNKSDMKINKRKKSPSGGEKEFLLEDQDWKKTNMLDEYLTATHLTLLNIILTQ